MDKFFRCSKSHIRNALFFILLTALISFFDLKMAQTLTKKDLEDLRGSTISSCFRNQRASALNAVVNDDVIRKYCDCFATTIFPAHTSVTELQAALYIKLKNGDQAMLDYFLKGRDLYEIAENCSRRAIKNDAIR
jgi:hypothetical protein